MTETVTENTLPLYVYLDGLVVATGHFWESTLCLLRDDPRAALKIPFWLLKGRAACAAKVDACVETHVAELPYRDDVLNFLKLQNAAGRKLILVTSSNTAPAQRVAQHLGLFEEVIGTDEDNPNGRNKLDRIREHSGGKPFAYLGHSYADRPIWAESEQAYVVAGSSGQAQRVSGVSAQSIRFIPRPRMRLRDVLRMLRPHQWVKNALLVVPALTAHRLADVQVIKAVLFGFLSFSLLASSIYIVNDLIDLPSDRKHPSKRRRPLAARRVPIALALLVAVGLTVASVALAMFLPIRYRLILGVYYVLTWMYSLAFKRKLLLDVLCLAGLYTIRIMAGGAATGILVSEWLLAFSMFLFLSLAFAKRFTELNRSALPISSKLSGRGYTSDDLELIRSCGPMCGLLSVLVLALYIKDNLATAQLYSRPWALWFLCPALLYWIMRIWFLAVRQQLHEDPVVFAVNDWRSYVVGAVMLLTMYIAH